jgi:hypothetical protein
VIYVSSEIPFHKWIEESINSNLLNSKKTFYKYQSLEDKFIKRDEKKSNTINYTIDNLSKNLLYFSHPSEFNDPFDSKMYVDNRAKEEQWIPYLCNKYKCDPDEAKIKIKDFTKWDDGLLSQQDIIILNMIAPPRVCCFSDRNDSILMWSHYADYHKGICLCFRAAKNFDDYYIPLRLPGSETPMNYARAGVFKKVIYNNDLIPRINPLDDPVQIDKIISENLLTKFPDWVYENEYRIIHPDFREYLESPHKSNETFEYYKECLEGVIFGCRINKNNAIRVYEAINKNYQLEESSKMVINYYKADESLNKREIIIRPISDMNEFINELDQ